MATSQKMVRFVTQLNRLTQESEMTWSARDVPHSVTEGTDDIIPVFFATTYQGRNLGIFEVRYRTYAPEFDRLSWAADAVLGFFDDDWRILSRYRESSSGLWALLESVRDQVAGVDEFIDSILPEEEDEEN